MSRRRFAPLVAVLLLCQGLPAAAQALTEVDFSHQLDSARAAKLARLVDRFNGQSKDYRVRLVQQTSAGAPAVLNLATPDNILDFASRKGSFRPLHKVMAASRERFDGKQFAPELRVRVADAKGNLNALPLAMSTPVLYYNKSAFRQAGLDPDRPPKTWWDVQHAAGKLFDAGMRCPYTSSWPAWVHIDNTTVLNGGELVGPKGNTLAFNGLVQVKHIALLASWHKSFYFHYFGPGEEAVARFAGGECAMLTAESSAAAGIMQVAKFQLGVAALPHYDDVYGAQPVDVLPDGAALWLLPGKKKDEYKVAARFVAFLMRPAVQKEWVQTTGFLPMTPAGMEALRASPAAPAVVAAAEKRLAMPRQGYRSKIGVGQGRLREILNEEIAFVWQNTKPAKEALDTAVSRANLLLSPAVAATTRK